MRNLIFTLALSLAFYSASAQARSGYRLDITTSPTDFADTISIEWERGQVYVPVSIHGKTYRFLLDTGAGMTAVYKGTPLADGPSPGTIVSHDAMGNSDTVRIVMMPAMQLGNTTIMGCRATVLEDNRPKPRIPQSKGFALAQAPEKTTDGILGFDLVNSGLAMKIDVQEQRLIITDRKRHFQKEASRSNAVVMRYWLNFHVPYIEVCPFGRYIERTLVDTGSPHFFAMNKRNYDNAMATERSLEGLRVEDRDWGSFARGHHGSEAEGEMLSLSLDYLALGKYAFTNVRAMTTQGGSHLGAQLLASGAVVFMPRSHRMLFLPYGGSDKPYSNKIEVITE